MSVLDRRLQVLLDQARFDRLEREARSTGRSVGAIVREAIDLHFADVGAGERRRRAAAALLAVVDDGPGEEWADVKAALADELTHRS